MKERKEIEAKKERKQETRKTENQRKQKQERKEEKKQESQTEKETKKRDVKDKARKKQRDTLRNEHKCPFLGEKNWVFLPKAKRNQKQHKKKPKPIRRVEGQVSWPLGPPHLTLKPSKKQEDTKNKTPKHTHTRNQKQIRSEVALGATSPDTLKKTNTNQKQNKSKRKEIMKANNPKQHEATATT